MSFYVVGRNDMASVREPSNFVPDSDSINRALYEAGVGLNLPVNRVPEMNKLSDREALLISAFSPRA